MSAKITAINQYIELLITEQHERLDKIANFEKFVNKNDPLGLQSVGKALEILKFEHEITRGFIFNIQNSMKLSEYKEVKP